MIRIMIVNLNYQNHQTVGCPTKKLLGFPSQRNQVPKTILNHLGNISCQIKYFLTLATNAYDNSNMFPKEKKKYSQFLQGDYIVCYLLSSRSFLKNR